ncbi:MAG: metallophosphoesterase [Alistipes sp.]|nr:metallophosphoesterase [Alistipes sp.]
MLFPIIFLLVYLGANAYLAWRIFTALDMLPLWVRVAVVVAIVAMSLMLFAAIGLRNVALPESLMRAMFNIGSVWLVFLLYSILAITLFDIVHWVVPSLRYGTLIAIVLTIFVMQLGYVHYRNPKVVEHRFSSEKITSPKRIVAISDVHLGYGTDRRALEQYVELINKQNPDMVLIAGDLIDNSVRPVVEQRMEEVLNNISAPDGVFMVAGNHEYISGIESAKRFIEKTNIRLLRDSVARVGEITIVGRDDKMNRERKALKDIADFAGYTIVLDHQPSSIEESAEQGADLHISGHTHRGQVWPLNWLTDAIYEQSYGYRKWRNSDVIVSSGLSLWGPPFRIGTDSELIVVEVVPEERSR